MNAFHCYQSNLFKTKPISICEKKTKKIKTNGISMRTRIREYILHETTKKIISVCHYHCEYNV